MKSPYVYRWTALKMFAIGGLFMVAFAYLMAPKDPFTIWQGLALVGLYLIFLFLGFIMELSLIRSSMYHRHVTHPADPDNLEKGRVYWLNGETHAIFVGKHKYSGKLSFSIYDVNKSEDPEDFELLFPGMVSLYISKVQEVQ